MPRTVISIDQEEKTWLDREAKSQKVAITEIVRRALRCYREQKATETGPDLAQLLKQTQGIRGAGDGFDYQRQKFAENGKIAPQNTGDKAPIFTFVHFRQHTKEYDPERVKGISA